MSVLTSILNGKFPKHPPTYEQMQSANQATNTGDALDQIVQLVDKLVVIFNDHNVMKSQGWKVFRIRTWGPLQYYLTPKTFSLDLAIVGPVVAIFAYLIFSS